MHTLDTANQQASRSHNLHTAQRRHGVPPYYVSGCQETIAEHNRYQLVACYCNGTECNYGCHSKPHSTHYSTVQGLHTPGAVLACNAESCYKQSTTRALCSCHQNQQHAEALCMRCELLQQRQQLTVRTHNTKVDSCFLQDIPSPFSTSKTNWTPSMHL
jgi:hypothetical protein